MPTGIVTETCPAPECNLTDQDIRYFIKATITKCLDETSTMHHSALDSLLTLRFQRFQKMQFVTV